MKRTFTCTIVFLFLFSLSSSAQTNNKTENTESPAGLNLVKVNLTAIPFNNFSFQYERAVASKISVGLGLRIMPEGNLPLKGIIKDIIDDDEAWEHFDNLKISNFAITPEVRFYMSKSVFRGFYIAPFARIASYSAKMPFEYEYDHALLEESVKGTIPLDGKISSFTGGFMAGAQWKLSKLVYLDWWILGPHYGTSNGTIDGRKDLSTEEQAGINDALSDLDDLPFVEGYEVNPSGARINIKGPWGGVRAGVALGFRF